MPVTAVVVNDPSLSEGLKPVTIPACPEPGCLSTTEIVTGGLPSGSSSGSVTISNVSWYARPGTAPGRKSKVAGGPLIGEKKMSGSAPHGPARTVRGSLAGELLMKTTAATAMTAAAAILAKVREAVNSGPLPRCGRSGLNVSMR